MNIHEAAIAIVERVEEDLYNRGLLNDSSISKVIEMRRAWLLLVLYTLEDAKTKAKP